MVADSGGEVELDPVILDFGRFDLIGRIHMLRATTSNHWNIWHMLTYDIHCKLRFDWINQKLTWVNRFYFLPRAVEDLVGQEI